MTVLRFATGLLGNYSDLDRQDNLSKASRNEGVMQNHFEALV